MNETHRESILISTVSDPSQIYDCIRNGLDSLGHFDISANDTVLIKPNLCCIKPCETGATTDPRVVEGIVTYLKNDRNVKSIYIIESDASQVLADMAFRLLGYERLAKKMNVQLANLSKMPYRLRHHPNNVFLKKVRYPSIMDKSGFLISVPKIKTHGERSFTSALKNQFGCNPDWRKYKLHGRLDDAIVDLNVAFKPNLIIVDGLIAMGGYQGPTEGVPIMMNRLIFGRDPVAIDNLIAKIIGINPRNVAYLQEAERRGIGTADYDTAGVVPSEFRSQFVMRRPRLSNMYNLFSRRD